MMAHEIPIQVPPPNPPTSKTNKHKPVPQPIRQLPNGEMPNFGPAKERKSKQHPQQQQILPNGEKPNFGNESKAGKKKLKKKSNNNNNTNPNTNNKVLSNGLAVNSTAVSKSAQANPDDKSKKGEGGYAGSSFHSSPEALGLPKPSFRASPKPTGANLQGQTPQTPSQMHSPVNGGVPNLHNAFFYQGMPPAGPPRYPVTSYPPSGPYHPGFNYNANAQGFINYLYPPTAVPQPPIPMQSYPLGPPAHLFAQHLQQQQFQQPQAQKITFNELMGSSK